ncbi:Cna B-type domain-containing protein [Trueperella bernardiae]|uniref:Cna B-type domain-containing protein n=1 Tax=Trueperella bernardiae TaxID=59561 RepID=UPI0015E0E436|nr:Cna B-type domain-containing protein [Trueperella bernardiae]
MFLHDSFDSIVSSYKLSGRIPKLVLHSEESGKVKSIKHYRFLPALWVACLTVFLVVMGTGLPPVAEAAPESPDRQILKCYEEGRVLYCEPDHLEKLIAQAGTIPTRIEIGNGTETLLTKTIVIPAGADIELVDANTAAWSSESKIIRDDGDFTGSLLKVEKGAKLTLSDGTGNGAGITIDSRAQYENVVKGSSFSPTILVEGELVMNAGTVTGARKMSNGGEGAVTVKGRDAKFTLNDGKITDNQRKGGQFGAANVALTDGATMVMNGGEISEGQSDYSPYAYGEAGGIGVFSGAHLTINGGTLTDNTGWAGNINVSHWLNESNVKPGDDTSDTRSTLVFNGGEISRGKAAFAGGGIDIFGNADVTMNGGTIADNQAPNGGGVNVMDMYINGDPNTYQEIDSDGSRWTKQHFGERKPQEWTKVSPARFTMNGGSVVRNSATRTGGGINVISNAVNLNAGLIEGNNANQQGGGVYVATKSYTAHFMDTLITENSTTKGSFVGVGGGVWLCPTGSMKIHVTNGVAVFDNKSPSSNDHHWGDDIAHDAYGGSTSARMHIDPRMLGGGESTLYKDGGYNKPRFDAENPGKKQVFDGEERESDESSDYRTSLQNAGLKTITDQNAKGNAKSWARLRITKNQAPRGGGIGSNGGLEFGTPEKTEVQVSKAWKDAEGNDLDDASKVAVKVQLVGSVGKDTFYIGQPAQLNADNNWTHTFKDLPKTKTVDGKQVEVKYSVEEQGVDGVNTVELGGTALDGLTITAPLAMSPVNVQLLQSTDGINKSPVGDPVVLDETNDWTYTFESLPATKTIGEENSENAKELKISYSVKELGVSGFTIKVEGDAVDGFTVTNTEVPPTTKVDVTKVWKDHAGKDLDPGSTKPVEVQLTRTINEETNPVGDPVELNAENEWKHTFIDLPQFVIIDGKRAKITYAVEELSVEGYTASISGSAADGFVVTNTKDAPAVTSVPVEKKWSGDVESDRPGSVTIKLLADGKDTGKSLELTAKDGWKATFEDLPKFVTVNGEKTEIAYTVVEVEVPDYTASINGSATDGYVVTNTKDTPPGPTPHKPEKPRDPMPRTGVEIGMTVALALGLLGAGVALVRRNRA